MVRYTIRGTHTGSELRGLPATGKQTETKSVAIYHIRDDKIAQHWNVIDVFGFWQQLGVMPPIEELIEQAKSKQA